MPHLHHRVSEKLTEMQHVQTKGVLHMRGETCQIRSVWLANHALALSNVPHRNPRAYDGREEQTNVEGAPAMR